MMKKLSNFLFAAVATAVLSACNVAGASQAYSFEDMTFDGFFGLGATVSQSDIGVTDGSFSMKYFAGAGGFVGARTETVIPVALNNPPGVKSVLVDVTLESAFAGGFADMGVMLFGHALNDPDPLNHSFGNQVQFAGLTSIAALTPGVTTTLEIVLGDSLGGYRPGDTFNEIFGPTDLDDLTVASAFQFYISKNVGIPITVYLDNVRLVVPEPATGMMLGLAGCIGLIARRQR